MDAYFSPILQDISNACSLVFNGYDAGDLGGDYYTANAPIVDTQIAKVRNIKR